MRWVFVSLTAIAFLAVVQPAHAHGGSLGKHGPTTRRGGGSGGGGGGPATEVDAGLGGPLVSPGAVTPGGRDRRPGSKRKRPVTQTFETSWELWWQVNRPGYLWHRAPARASGPVTPGGEGPGNAMDRAQAVALLRRLVDPATKAPPDVRASACLALAKVADPKSVVEPLRVLAMDARAPKLVRESAVLAMGLLRRSDASRQLPASELDRLRARLLMLWDQRVDGDRVPLHARARQFAMIALGLLGGQPFQDTTKPGLLVSTLIWERVRFPFKKPGYREAVLLALGNQPHAGATGEIREGVRKIAAGERLFGTRWHARTRGYALTTLTGWNDTYAAPLLLKHLGDARQHPAVHIAALLSLDARSAVLPTAVRGIALRLLAHDLLPRKEQRLLVYSLGLCVLGGLLNDELRTGDGREAKAGALRDALPPLRQALSHKLWTVRGFAALALGRAFHRTDGSPHVGEARNRVGNELRLFLLREKEPSARGAAAIALGLMGATAREDLRALVGSKQAPDALRGHAAVALALDPGFVAADRDVVAKALTAPGLRAPVRAEFARAAARMDGHAGVPALLRQLRDARDVMHASAVANALGHFASPEALSALASLVNDPARSELVRAMAVVAIGRMLDVEKEPSLARFTRGFVYPLWTDAMRELLTIL